MGRMTAKKDFRTLVCFWGFILFSLILPASSQAIVAGMPVPPGQQDIYYDKIASPVLTDDPLEAKPVGFGSAAQGGNTLSVRFSLPAFDGPVDIYVAFTLSTAPAYINILSSDGQTFKTFLIDDVVQQFAMGTLPSGVEKWKSNQIGPLDDTSFGDIPLSDIESGIYYVYFLVTPAGRVDRYYLWETYFLNPLLSDFQTCSGKPSNPIGIQDRRLLIATSPDGINFSRTNTVLADNSSVPDAIVLPSGRMLVYYVTSCKITSSQNSDLNEIVAAVSDNNGNSWAYKNVTFNGVPSGSTPPVDPNVVLKPDGSLRLFATIDPDVMGTQKARTYSFISTDGGFTYNMEGERFSVSGMDVLDPENFRFSDTNWKIYAGTRHATSTDGNTFTDQGTICVATDDLGRCFIVADITDFSSAAPLYRMYVHGIIGTSEGIRSLTSTDTNTWTLEAGNRLTIDTSAGKEYMYVNFPTVGRLNNGTYIMIYETRIP